MYAVLRQRGYDPVKLDPWYYPSVDGYHDVSLMRLNAYHFLRTPLQIIESAGFTVNEIGLHPYIVSLETGLYEWLRLFLRETVLGDFSDEEAHDILKDIENMCEPDCKDERGRWSVMYVRLRVAATRL